VGHPARPGAICQLIVLGFLIGRQQSVELRRCLGMDAGQLAVEDAHSRAKASSSASLLPALTAWFRASRALVSLPWPPAWPAPPIEDGLSLLLLRIRERQITARKSKRFPGAAGRPLVLSQKRQKGDAAAATVKNRLVIDILSPPENVDVRVYSGHVKAMQRSVKEDQRRGCAESVDCRKHAAAPTTANLARICVFRRTGMGP